MKFRNCRIDLSLTAIVLVALAGLFLIKETERWKQDNTIHYDIASYYAYLPGALIYHDLTYKFVDSDTVIQKRIWTMATPEGRRVNKMSSGLSFMYAPFFMIAHGIALSDPDSYAPTGFSAIYDLLLLLSALCYGLIGLFFVRKILKKLQINDGIIALTILSLFFGTNMMVYAAFEPMTHVYLFCLIAILIWKIMQWHEAFRIKHAVIIGLLIGLIALIRPVDLLFGFIFILYGMYNIRSIKDKFHLLLNKWNHVLIIGIASFLVASIQMIYWKYSTGSWLYWSYTGENFYFTNPHIIEGLFGFRKGWYIYTPVMFIATIGFFFVKRYEKRLTLALPLVWILFTYIIFSWWCWWYGFSVSCRPYVDCYALMGIGLAAFLQWVWDQKKLYYTILFIGLVGVCIWYACLTTYHYHRGWLSGDSMTYEAWKLSAFRNSPPGEYWNALKSPNYDGARDGKE